MTLRILTLLAIPLLIGACATAPKLETAGVDSSLKPDLDPKTLDLSTDRRIHWGGVIIASRNLEQESQIEVLGYPLDGSGRPNTDSAPLGRFLATQKGYLETLDFSPGKSVSFVGKLQSSRTGKIGDSEYRYPTLLIEQSAVWDSRNYTRPQFHFGIGIGIHN